MYNNLKVNIDSVLKNVSFKLSVAVILFPVQCKDYIEKEIVVVSGFIMKFFWLRQSSAFNELKIICRLLILQVLLLVFVFRKNKLFVFRNYDFPTFCFTEITRNQVLPSWSIKWFPWQLLQHFPMYPCLLGNLLSEGILLN